MQASASGNRISLRLLYLVLTYGVTKIVAFIEKRFSNSYVPRKAKVEGREAR